MTATATDQRPRAWAGWLASVKATLDKPLTSYYLLLGSSGLLLTLGLMMVLSSSSVWSYEHNRLTATPYSSSS